MRMRFLLTSAALIGLQAAPAFAQTLGVLTSDDAIVMAAEEVIANGQTVVTAAEEVVQMSDGVTTVYETIESVTAAPVASTVTTYASAPTTTATNYTTTSYGGSINGGRLLSYEEAMRYPEAQVTGIVSERVETVSLPIDNVGHVNGPNYDVNLDLFAAPAPAPVQQIQPAVAQTTTVYREPEPQPEPVYTPPPPPVVVETAAVVADPYPVAGNFYLFGGAGLNALVDIDGDFDYDGGGSDDLEIEADGLGFNVNAGLGYRVRGLDWVGLDDQVRFGAEFQHINNESGKLKLDGAKNNWDNSSSIHSAWLRGEYAPDFGWGMIRPYIGAGIGWVSLDYSDGSAGWDRESTVGYKGILGLTAAFTENLEGYAEYSYVYAPGIEADVENYPAKGSANQDYSAHLGTLGLRLNF